MKVIIFLGGFFPSMNHGGPVVSIDNLCRLLSDKIDFYIVTKDHDLGTKERFKDIKDTWMIKENYNILYWPDSFFTKSRINNLLKEINPDLIYINSLFSYKIVIPILKGKGNIPALIAPRGQLCKNAFRKKIKKYMYLFIFKSLFKSKTVFYQFTSMEEKLSILKHIKVRENKIFFLDNISIGPTQNVGIPIEKSSNNLKIVFISRIHPKKNLDFALSLINNLSGDIIFNIYGPIEDTIYWENCKNIIANYPKNIIVNYNGVISHEDVYKVFTENHVFLFPTKSENYGHVIPEALIMGCSVITSDQTPWQANSDQMFLHSIPLNKKDEYLSVIKKFVAMNHNEYKRLSSEAILYAHDKIDQQKIKNEYINVFTKIIDYRGE